MTGTSRRRSSLRGCWENVASPPKRDEYAREKDAGRANSSAIGATEDVLSRRSVRFDGRGFVFRQPATASRGRCEPGGNPRPKIILEPPAERRSRPGGAAKRRALRATGCGQRPTLPTRPGRVLPVIEGGRERPGTPEGPAVPRVGALAEWAAPARGQVGWYRGTTSRPYTGASAMRPAGSGVGRGVFLFLERTRPARRRKEGQWQASIDRWT